MTLDARIVVVDDDAVQRELLAGFLEDLGVAVREAADGPAALRQVRGSPVFSAAGCKGFTWRFSTSSCLQSL